jgi:hypothetical protein
MSVWKKVLLIVGLGLTASWCLILKAQSQPKAANPPYSLSRDDIAFGKSQVQAMISDRPRMAEFANENDFVWTWAARQFAGEYTGARYYWNADPAYNAQERFFACHLYPMKGRSGWITVNEVDESGYVMSGEQMWAGAVYELLNARKDLAYKSLYIQALAGTLSKSDFQRQNVELEYIARKQLFPFFKQFVQPSLLTVGRRSHAGYWLNTVPDTFDEWFKTCSKNKGYVSFSFYSHVYDSEIAPRVKSK